MDTYNIYKDIQARTGGEIYIGVVGPVRTGKVNLCQKIYGNCSIAQYGRTVEKGSQRPASFKRFGKDDYNGRA